MNKSVKMSIAITVVLVAMGLLFAQGFKASGGLGLYLTLEEAIEVATEESDKFIQIEANVVNSSVKYDAKKPELIFDLADEKDNRINVTYLDIKPDNFDSGYPVIVEGRFTGENKFVADKLKVKCPSKYEEAAKKK